MFVTEENKREARMTQIFKIFMKRRPLSIFPIVRFD